MPDELLISDLTKVGVDTGAVVDAWSDSVALLAALDAVGRAGSNTIVKIDGERSGPDVYTVVVSGGRLGEKFFRRDGSDLRSLLREALSFYARHATADRGER